MIECTSKNGVKVYVTSTYDVEPNIGGFYCEVYLDENCDHKVDDFCISADVVNLDLDELYIEKHIRDTVITVEKTLAVKIRNRQRDNRRILGALNALVERYPELRFGQILFNYKFVNWSNTDDGVRICDPFHEEPADTFKRVCEQLKQLENKNNGSDR
jgi:hypothetical protein